MRLLLEAARAAKEAAGAGARSPLPVAHQNEDGETALLLASKHGHTEICKILLSEPGGERALNRTDTRGASPLLLSVAHGHDEIAIALLAAGATVGHPTPPPDPWVTPPHRPSSPRELRWATPL